ncbi:MAG: hypothetical protein E7G05_16005 [Pseudomonas aeruginosa]|nr:hypothetical protein [Pseudomonas aeruginosa]MDU3699584.1 hypothetical protein [Pseudomonas aeruginosa]
MSNELTDVRCPCGAEFQADSYDAGFIAGSGMCQNCDAALPPKDICTCPSGDGSLRHPCPAHPAVEQAGGDEREAKPGLFCRDCGDRLSVRGVCSIYCPKCEKGDDGSDSSGVPAEAAPPESVALLYRRSDGNDRAWSVTCDPHYMEFFRKADGYESKLLVDAALAQPSPAPELAERGTQHRFSTAEQTCRHDFAGVWWNDNGETKTGRECRHCGFFVADVIKAQAEQAEAERPEVVAWRYGSSGGIVSDKACLDEWKSGGEYQSLMTVAQHERIVKAWIERWKAYIELSAKIAAQRDAADARLHEVATACATAEQERDAALAEVERLRQFERICEGLPQDAIDGGWTVQGIRCYAKRLEDQLKVDLARVAELEKQEPVATIAKVPGEDWNGLHFYRDLQGMQPGTKLYAAPVAQAGQVPAAWYYDAPSQAEAAIIDIRGMWDEDECPAYEDVASALRRMLASAPGKEGL